MASSGTFNFSTSESRIIIEDAYRRASIIPEQLTFEQVQSAQNSINFILSGWLNKELELWTIKQEMMQLVTNQATYDLPTSTSDVLDVTIRTSQRNLGGTPAASSGIAVYAFDGNPLTACTQTAPNGNISYDWGTTNLYAIAMVGVQSNATLTYTLVFEYSNDGATWTQVGAPPAQSFTSGAIIWFVISAPIPGSLFRVRETGGATLNIQELYFNTQLNDFILTRDSRYEYMGYPQKNLTGRPSLYYLDRQINPKITLWPVPTDQYNNLFYTRIEKIEDVGSLTDNIAIPSRFLSTLAWELSMHLEIKKPNYDLNKVQVLANLAAQSFKEAAEEDCERVPIRIFADYYEGYLQR